LPQLHEQPRPLLTRREWLLQASAAEGQHTLTKKIMRQERIMIGRRLLSAAIPLAAIIGLATPIPGRTQSLSGIKIGDTVSSVVKQLGSPPNKVDRSGPFTSAMWKLGDKNRLSVMTRANDGKIVYIENDWGQISPDN
jgi:hypothetical protein